MNEREKLFKIIEPYSDWWAQDGEEVQENAKEALKNFYYSLIKITPDSDYQVGRRGIHTYYLFYLLQLRQGMEQKKYVMVCHELYNAMTRISFFQRRVWYNVVELLAKYLELEEDNV